MAINYIPNDPDAGSTAPQMRQQAKHANGAAGVASFTLSNSAPDALYQPGTQEFLFWQSREAALLAVDAFESSAGSFKAWQGYRKKLSLLADAGEDLNAFYDRSSFSFFHQQVGNRTFFSGESTDVVAHEVGHGLLDAIRPDLWDATYLETGAFHEGVGDIIAILTALNDKETRKKLLRITTTLRKRDFVESTAENLSAGIRALQPNHNAAEPRHAFNKLQFQLPQTLPDDGGPGVLINEVHSFCQVFTGCFWDLVANLFGAMSAKTDANLVAATKTAGKLLFVGAQNAVLAPRFFQSVGRAMVLADDSLNGGANRALIGDAFQRHGIALGSSASMAPSMALAGAAPRAGKLDTATRRDLTQRLGVNRGGKLAVAKANVFGTPVVRAEHTREVRLDDVDKRLKGVVALATEPVVVGASGKKAVVFGALPHAMDTEVEVSAFVRSLVEHDQVEFAAPKSVAAFAKKKVAETVRKPTHVVRTVGGKKVLQRIRFVC